MSLKSIWRSRIDGQKTSFGKLRWQTLRNRHIRQAILFYLGSNRFLIWVTANWISETSVLSAVDHFGLASANSKFTPVVS